MAKKALAVGVMPETPPEKLVELARVAENAGLSALFTVEAGNDAIACALALGLATRSIKLGTAIANIYLRHPALLAAEACAAQEFTGGRFILGLGIGHRETNRRMGIEMGQPLARMRETVGAVREAVSRGRVQPVPSAYLPIYLAGLSAPMIRLAGEIADGVIFNFFPPARVRQAIGELHEGARQAGRDTTSVAAVLFATAFISDDLEAARRPARKLLSRYAALTFYGNMMARAGFAPEIEQLRAAGGDSAKAQAAISDALIDATTLVGPESRIRERIAELTAPGIDTIIVFVNPVNESREAAIQRAIRVLST